MFLFVTRMFNYCTVCSIEVRQLSCLVFSQMDVEKRLKSDRIHRRHLPINKKRSVS